MAGRTSRIRKYMLFSKKSVILGENYDFIEKIFGKKLIFKFLMAPLDAQQNFMSMKYKLFSFHLS